MHAHSLELPQNSLKLSTETGRERARMDGKGVYAVAVELLVEVVAAEGFRRVQGACPSFLDSLDHVSAGLSFPSNSCGQRSLPLSCECPAAQ